MELAFHGLPFFEKGDLNGTDCALLMGKWVYLAGRGFYRIEKPLFDQVVAVLNPDQVSHFVNTHRIWLNSQEEFQTHLASVESHLTYTVLPNRTLCFYSKIETHLPGAKDFGDWIYYRGQGFFSKRYAHLWVESSPRTEDCRE